MSFNKKQLSYLVILAILNVVLLVFLIIPVEDTSAPTARKTSFLEETHEPVSKTDAEAEPSKTSRSIKKEGDKIIIEYEPIAELTEEEVQEMLDSWRININEAPLEELVKLPRIGPALAQRIIDYREKHGIFVVESDLQKVSGVGPAMLNNIRDLIHYGEIDPKLLRERTVETKTGKINLNEAQAEDLTRLPRIGPAIAERIIEYREEIGGFSSIEQLMEVSGIGPATFANIKDEITVSEAGMTRGAVRRQEKSPRSAVPEPESPTPVRATSRSTGAVRDGIININRASKEELTQLPRIGPSLADRIIEYRSKIGRFNNIEQLKEVSGIGPALFENIKDRITVR